MRTHRVALPGGVEAAVEDAGTGPAVLLLHAGVSERHMWDPQWTWLPESHRTIRWDWRGFGTTPHAPGPFSYADDVRAIMDALDIERATLIGCSFGGAAALQVSIQHRSRVERLVLVAPGIPGYEWPNPADVERMFAEGDEAFRQEDIPHALSVMEKVWLVGPRRDTTQVNPVYLARAHDLLLLADQPDNGAVSLDEVWSAVDKLPDITVPVLVIVGSEDVPSVRAGAEFLAVVLPDARYARIDDAAHLPSLEQPAVFNGLLRQWLGDTAGRTVAPKP